CDEVVPFFEAIRTTPVLGKLTLELQRTPRRAARSATLSVRVTGANLRKRGRLLLNISIGPTDKSGSFKPPSFSQAKCVTKLWLQPPASLQSQSTQAIEVYVIEACEESPPEGEKPISWLLLTTIEVKDFESACQCLKWYSDRWLIERYHYCLKSGCRIEQLQLEDGERIKRALATYAIVAWRLLWLTYEARKNPERTVEGILETHEWQALYCKIHKTNKPPTEAPSLGECVRWIARLGGFLGRKGDGEPGIQTLWRGFQRLNDIAGIWQLLYSESIFLSKAQSINKLVRNYCQLI
ncbi:MAG: IS4 family transposase, partial [Fischerella sp. CENA71]|nr:IS4 family transposase [Fischerella sp. CENA71]